MDLKHSHKDVIGALEESAATAEAAAAKGKEGLERFVARHKEKVQERKTTE